MGLYEEYGLSDIIAPLKQRIESGQVTLTENKIIIRETLHAATPWVHQRIPTDRHCIRYHDVYFDHYGLVPRTCYHCLKMVCRPRTLKELFTVREVQQELDLFSKCGLELRTMVPSLYGAYWYSPIEGGLDQAREMHRTVREALNRALPDGPTLILKRGCTEMEMKKGPSDTWKYTVEDGQLELLLDTFIEADRQYDAQPAHIVRHVIRQWIEYAYAHGDETYREYVSRPFHPSVVTYHGSDHRPEDLDWPT